MACVGHLRGCMVLDSGPSSVSYHAEGREETWDKSLPNSEPQCLHIVITVGLNYPSPLLSSCEILFTMFAEVYSQDQLASQTFVLHPSDS